MTQEKSHAILGNGQIGNSIFVHIKSKLKTIYDIGEWESLRDITVDVLHICIPYSEHFVDIVKQAQEVFLPSITIVHSTVTPSTTCRIHDDHVYSPVMGRHDGESMNLTPYKKFFACADEGYLKREIKEIFSLSMQYWGTDTDSLEFAKIQSTNYMYWNLIYQKYLYTECIENGYSFEKVYKIWNENYNNGIRDLYKDMARPIYKYIGRRTPGGHCLPNNIYLSDDKISKLLKEYHEYK